ncbi:hypothetical protein PILCRDRAFT_815315 [Piloderma croceum F 1598]|uniref:Obg domain-containing protein n=1 Tax=Piloderma croceum (strain F 1598) TaxID=765440 RepID=A0A0C3G4X1_PILCF|nr:hypothetical protein PILCRDRAFT_815315 [Piloderma croceum F 1598]
MRWIFDARHDIHERRDSTKIDSIKFKLLIWLYILDVAFKKFGKIVGANGGTGGPGNKTGGAGGKGGSIDIRMTSKNAYEFGHLEAGCGGPGGESMDQGGQGGAGGDVKINEE